jgi:lysophospholipase L1-like esterase
MDQRPATRHGVRLAAYALVGLGLLGALVLGEAAARQFFNPAHFYVRTPGWEIVFKPSPTGTPGIHRPARIVINRHGLRGDMPGPGRPRLVAVGGSTTEDIMLNDADTWTGQLQKLLRADDPQAWVGNMGKSGTNAIHHAMQLDKVLPQLPRIDLVIVLVGLNDMLYDFGIHHPRDMPESWHERQEFMYAPPPRPSLAQRSALYHLAARAAAGLALLADPNAAVVREVEYGKMTEAYRARRAQVRPEDFIADAPALDTALAEYRARLDRVAQAAARHGARIAFLTQPSLWRADMEEAERNLLYAGGIGGTDQWFADPRTKWYGVNALASMLDAYNDTLRAFCRERNHRCIDVAAALPKSAAMFYDDFHFSAAGAAAVAAIVYRGLGRLDRD